MKALVIGASGHLGNAITRALLDRGWEISAAGRQPTPPLNLSGLPVTYLQGDADASGQLRKWIPGHDLVIDAAAPYPMSLVFPGRLSEGDPFIAAEKRTRRFLDAISLHDAIFVYIGSFITLVTPKNEIHQLRERIIRWTLPYFEVKTVIESQILDACRQGLRAVIVNPTYCLGPWDLHDRRVCTIPLLLSGEIPGTISQILNVIDVRDVADGVVAAIDHRNYGKPLLMAGHTISTSDLYALICQMGNVPMPPYAPSATLAALGSYWTEVAFNILGQQTPIISAGMMMATAFDYLESSRLSNAPGVVPRPLEQTIVDAIKWYRTIGYCE